MADSELRQRKPAAPQDEQSEPQESPRKTKKTTSKNADDEATDFVSIGLDVLRVISFLFVVSCALSYVISGGESWFWGMKNKPNYMKVDYWKEKIQGPVAYPLPFLNENLLIPSLQPPPIYMTLEELAAYDGTDPEKPLYLAINGTIYDVSKGRRIYGPGGSYHYFAGCDASRGFVTGCFADDRTADLRNVEQMYLPRDDPEVDSHWTAEELAALKVQELESAKQQVYDALKHWVDFFARSPKYTKLGYVLREDGWLEKEELKPLCAPADNGRSPRKPPTKDE